jgi:outer membrane protein OmpA-like peptidoglycan-associated protein
MPETLLTSLLNTLDSHSVGAIAGALGEPEQSVSRCMETGVTSVLAGLAGKSEDQSTLRRMIDLAPSAGDTNWSQVASSISDPNSHMLSAGKSIMSGLFGNQEGAITAALGRFCGLRPGVTANLLGMAAPMVLGFLSKRMRNEGMSIGDLGRTLQREGSTIRNALPPELRDLFATRTAAKTVTSSPVVAQAVEHEKTSSHWLATALALGALLLGLFWLFNHARRPTRAFVIPIPQHVPMGSASREVPDAMKQKLPENIDLRYKTGSAKLLPDSQQELNDLAATLMANPSMHAKISGYTDDIGNATQNLRLSQARANGVMEQLVSKGISSDRLTAQGYGEEFPVADNSTAEGRAQNRRVAITE